MHTRLSLNRQLDDTCHQVSTNSRTRTACQPSAPPPGCETPGLSAKIKYLLDFQKVKFFANWQEQLTLMSCFFIFCFRWVWTSALDASKISEHIFSPRFSPQTTESHLGFWLLTANKSFSYPVLFTGLGSAASNHASTLGRWCQLAFFVNVLARFTSCSRRLGVTYRAIFCYNIFSPSVFISCTQLSIDLFLPPLVGWRSVTQSSNTVNGYVLVRDGTLELGNRKICNWTLEGGPPFIEKI